MIVKTIISSVTKMALKVLVRDRLGADGEGLERIFGGGEGLCCGECFLTALGVEDAAGLGFLDRGLRAMT